jgi:hypothetical protein
MHLAIEGHDVTYWVHTSLRGRVLSSQPISAKGKADLNMKKKISHPSYCIERQDVGYTGCLERKMR